jgi:aspartate/methionine/tyrosine aminotransferase
MGQVAVTVGASQALFVSLQALIQQDDEVAHRPCLCTHSLCL